MRRLALLFVLLTAACGQSALYSDLSERHANEVVVALEKAGVDAHKRPGNDDRWSVVAPRSDFAYAIAVLEAAGLPREDRPGIAELFEKKGLVSTPLEERARFTQGLSQELSSTLTQIDGVQVARVHIVHPVKDPLAASPPPASASVFLRHEPGADLGEEVATIRALVANAVEGVSYDEVSVALFEGEPPRPPTRPEPALRGRFGLTVLGGLVALVALAGGMLARGGRGTSVPSLLSQSKEARDD